MSEREALIKELSEKFPDTFRLGEIADFVIADRKRIVDGVVNLIPYLLFDNSPAGIKLWIKTLEETAGTNL